MNKSFAILLNDARHKMGVKLVHSKNKQTFKELCSLKNFQAAIVIWENGSKKVIKGSLPDGLQFKS